jgi:hypothetical protein
MSPRGVGSVARERRKGTNVVHGIQKATSIIGMVGILICIMAAQSTVSGDSVQSTMQASQVYAEYTQYILFFLALIIVGRVPAQKEG